MKKLLTLALLGIVFYACQTDPIAKLQQKLTELDKAMGGAAVTDKAKADEFVKTSEELAALLENQYVDVLLKAAGLAKTAGQPQKAIELYTKVLTSLDKAMGGAAVTDKSKADEFIKTSEELAALVEKSNPDQYVDVLLKAAGLAKTVDQPQKAIDLYARIANGLPQHKKAPTALFMIGFVEENDLNDLVKAKATYELFLLKYPNDPDFADDAQNAIKLLGISPEDIIKGFEKQGQAQ